MRTFLTIILLMTLHQGVFSQVDTINKDRRLRGLPADYKREPGDPPMRGERDLRPRQFPAKTMQFQHKDISTTIQRFSKMKIGDSTMLPVSGIPDLHIVLVRHYQRQGVDAWSFRVTNQIYKGGWLFINRTKRPGTGETNYSGQYIRKGFSDALLLRKVGDKMFLEIVDQETIVQD